MTTKERQDKVFELAKIMIQESTSPKMAHIYEVATHLVELIYGKQHVEELQNKQTTTFIGNPEQVANAFASYELSGLEHNEYKEGFVQGVKMYLEHLQDVINQTS